MQRKVNNFVVRENKIVQIFFSQLYIATPFFWRAGPIATRYAAVVRMLCTHMLRRRRRLSTRCHEWCIKTWGLLAPAAAKAPAEQWAAALPE